LRHFADVRNHVLFDDFDCRIARELAFVHQRQDVHGDGQFAHAGQREAFVAMQADVLSGLEVECSRPERAIGFRRNPPPAIGQRVDRGRGQARAA
jgi:hypothetical protein